MNKIKNGSMMENSIKFRISNKSKEKIRDYFGNFSAMREYVLKVVENKGEAMKHEIKNNKKDGG